MTMTLLKWVRTMGLALRALWWTLRVLWMMLGRRVA